MSSDSQMMINLQSPEPRRETKCLLILWKERKMVLINSIPFILFRLHVQRLIHVTWNITLRRSFSSSLLQKLFLSFHSFWWSNRENKWATFFIFSSLSFSNLLEMSSFHSQSSHPLFFPSIGFGGNLQKSFSWSDRYQLVEHIWCFVWILSWLGNDGREMHDLFITMISSEDNPSELT